MRFFKRREKKVQKPTRIVVREMNNQMDDIFKEKSIKHIIHKYTGNNYILTLETRCCRKEKHFWDIIVCPICWIRNCNDCYLKNSGCIKCSKKFQKEIKKIKWICKIFPREAKKCKTRKEFDEFICRKKKLQENVKQNIKQGFAMIVVLPLAIVCSPVIFILCVCMVKYKERNRH